MIFSPSQTSTFQRCPMAHHLSRVEGWRPKLLAKRDAAAIVGSAFAAGMESWNRARQRVREIEGPGHRPLTTYEHESAIARLHADTAIARLLDAGCVIPPAIRSEFDYAATLAARAVERVCAADPIPADWTVVDVERAFEEHGNARPDLVCRDETGALVIVDYKCAMALKDAYVAERLDTYRRSAQMHHYVWAARTVYAEMYEDNVRVYRYADVRRYAIVLVRLEPWKVWFQPYEVDERLLARWTDSAWATWDRMATPGTEGPPSHWEACTTKYGPCEYVGACWDAALDRDVMALDYVRLPRQEDAAKEAV